MMSAPRPNLLWTDCNQRSCSKGSRVQFKANVPLHRLGLPEEMASAALFLA
jgi:NAD(P)-dependent dehydrogenase (short-subunit alcohol dehydrogenase family)